MKKLFLSNTGLSAFNLGMELELIDIAMKAGEEVFILKCNNEYSSCFFNPCHNLLACAICAARTDRFHTELQVPKANIFPMENLLKGLGLNIPEITSLTALIEYEYDGINIGRGVASSVISLERDFDISSDSGKQAMIQEQLKMAINSYLNYRKIIERIKPDEIILYNGRFAEQYPMVAYCLKNDIKFQTYERGASDLKYQLFEDNLPQSISVRSKLMKALWKENESEEAAGIAKEWYLSKRNGTNKNRKNYLDSQSRNRLPDGFDSNKHNVVIFNSSEDEIKTIQEWTTSLYSEQNEAIRKIFDFFTDRDPDIHFYLRMHPNLEHVRNPQTEELNQLNHKNLTVIAPLDDVDTYAMMEACDISLTFGSTTGIEATFWNNTSILFGRSFYEQLDAVYMPQSYEELFELIGNKDLPPKAQKLTLPYAYFISKYGDPFQEFVFKGKGDSTFKGKEMSRFTPLTLVKLTNYLYNIPLWNKMNKVVFKRALNLKDIFQLKSHTTK